MEDSITFPLYYELDTDMIVKIDSKDGKVTAVTSTGKPYPPYRAMLNGWRTTEAAFNEQISQSRNESASASDASR